MAAPIFSCTHTLGVYCDSKELPCPTKERLIFLCLPPCPHPEGYLGPDHIPLANCVGVPVWLLTKPHMCFSRLQYCQGWNWMWVSWPAEGHDSDCPWPSCAHQGRSPPCHQAGWASLIMIAHIQLGYSAKAPGGTPSALMLPWAKKKILF